MPPIPPPRSPAAAWTRWRTSPAEEVAPGTPPSRASAAARGCWRHRRCCCRSLAHLCLCVCVRLRLCRAGGRHRRQSCVPLVRARAACARAPPAALGCAGRRGTARSDALPSLLRRRRLVVGARAPRRGRPVETAAPEDWDASCRVNIRGHAVATKAVLPHMKHAGGSIVFLGSISRTRATWRSPGAQRTPP